MTVTVRYYARLKEEAGLAQEQLDTKAVTVGELWDEAAKRHRFSLDRKLVRPAQADEFCSWDAPVQPGTIVFMPPVAGG